MTGNSTNEYRDEVRRQAVQQAAKWTLAAVAGLVVIAGTGWWFYLEDKIVGLAGGVPPGAVMAFDRPERCPSGWTEFADAAGRTIIGQGSGGVDANGRPLTARKYRDGGGEEEHFLTENEMPAHQHELKTMGQERDDEGNGSATPEWVVKAGSVNTESAGSNDAHNNMPPYIALYFCKKD